MHTEKILHQENLTEKKFENYLCIMHIEILYINQLEYIN